MLILQSFPSGILHAQQGCVMSCPPMVPPVEISLPVQCQATLTYQLIGVELIDCPGDIEVDIMENGQSIGDQITADMIGQTYMVVISHPASGQSCMTNITVVDKQAPVVTCPEDVTLGCAVDLEAYNAIHPGDVQDCSPYTVTFNDVLESSGTCDGGIVARYIRTYYIIDDYNNGATCEQVISLAQAELGDVVFPPSLTGPDALICFPLPDTSPVNTGYPTIEGNDLLPGMFCNLSAIRSDIIVPICSGSYKILRTWTVVDWCNGNATTTQMQTIEVLDSTPPVVNAPANITVSTGPLSCQANAVLLPAEVLEDCSEVYTVRMQGPFGTIHSNGGPIPPLPIGIHNITFIATTDCGVSGQDIMQVKVEDLQPPAPVCHQYLAIPVNLEGTALVPASVFNAGSTDNCGDVYVKVKRMSTPEGEECFNPGNPDNQFDDFLQLCCEDIPNNNIMVILRVYDLPPGAGPVSDTHLEGHYNDCMVEVQVQDKFAPELICPSDLTISCEFPFTEENLEVFGSVVTDEEDREQICIDDPGAPGGPGLECIGVDGLAVDNCHVTVEELDAVIEINQCGAGTITRTFRATDDGGLQTTCQQVITIVNFDLFSEADITWPQDYTTFDICEVNLLDPEDLPAPYNQPTLQDGPCDMVGATYDDDFFDFSNNDQACFKILRTWTVMDWCQLNTETVGIWTHIQVIKVMNSVAPTIEPLADINECSFDPECEGLEVSFEATAEDDCSGPASLIWRYYIDENNDNSFEYTSAELSGESISFERDMPIGDHRVLFTVWDRCGNSSTEDQLVTIRSCKNPSAKCIHGLSTNLMAMDADGDGTADWGMVTLQAEMFDAGSDHPCGNPITLSFSSDPTETSAVFDCEDLGINEVELWAIDENGLTDFCITTIEIQDNNDICPPSQGGTGIISGNISVPQSGTLTGAMVYLDGSHLQGVPSAGNGQFVFPLMPLGGEYAVRPVREGDDRNGVTTLDLVKIQKHLLGLEAFTTPYQFIAADVNNSKNITAIDIIQLRKLILGYTDTIPNNQSWRFVEKQFTFPDPLNPWLSVWPEVYPIVPFAQSMNDVDFHAIKVGDLNLSASLQAGGGQVLPRGSKKSEVSYTVEPMPNDNSYKVDIFLEDAAMYQGLQFSFNWNQGDYQLVDWSHGALVSPDEIRMPDSPKGNASLSTFSIDGWTDEKLHLMTLWVRPTGATVYPFNLNLNPRPTMPIAITLGQQEEIPVQLTRSNSQMANIDNRPNPFTDLTTIHFASAKAEKAVLRVYDADGNTVHTRSVDLFEGQNEFVIRKAELGGPGLYTYELKSELQYSTNRMLIVD